MPEVRKEHGWFDKIIFWFVCGKPSNILKKGHSIEMDDLSGIKTIDFIPFVEEFSDAWKKEGELEEKYGQRRPGIRIVRTLILRCFCRLRLRLAFINILLAAAQLWWVYYLYKLIEIYVYIGDARDQGADVDWWGVYRTGILTAMICFVQYFATWAQFPLKDTICTLLRVTFLSSLYKVTLNTKGSSLINASRISNLMSGHIEMMTQAISLSAATIIIPFRIAGTIVLGLYFAGWPFIPAVLFSLIFSVGSPMAFVFGQLNELNVAVMSAQDDRVKLTYQTIYSALQMKLCTWENNRAEAIKKIRAMEHNILRQRFKVFMQLPAIGHLSVMTSILFMLLLWIELDMHQFNLQTALASFTLVLEFTLQANEFNTLVLGVGISSWGPLKTFENFLRLESAMKDTSIEHDKALPPEHSQIKGLKRISLQGNFRRWPMHADGGLEAETPNDDFVLKNIDIEVFDGELLCILGPTGAGKTLLLMAMLQEAAKCLPSSTKECFPYHHPIVGSVAYAGQDQWIYTGTIRENILFGSDFDSERYSVVVKECGLEPDLKVLKHGDFTLVGSRGIKLSGGQKARVGLARLAYKDADVYLLDDPFSSLDSSTGRKIYNNLICGLLRKKTRVLVTHHSSYFQNDENVFVMGNKGEVLAVGTWADVKKAPCVEEIQMPLLSISDFDEDCDSRRMALFKQWSYAEKRGLEKSTSASFLDKIESNSDEETSMIDPAHNASFRMPSMSFWSRTFEFKGVVLTFCMSVLCQSLMTCLPVYIALWVTSPTGIQMAKWWSLGLVAMSFTAYTLHLCYRRILCFTKLKQNTVLHNNMVDAVVRAPMVFFDNNPTGKILNRFSRDMSIMDKVLIVCVDRLIEFNAAMSTGFILACVVNIYFFTPIVILLSFSIYLLLRVSRPSIVRLRIMETTLLPYAQAFMLESLEGITTIRAFDAKGFCISSLHRYLADWSKAALALIEVNRWSTFYLACTNYFFFVVLLLGSFVILQTNVVYLNTTILSVLIMLYKSASMFLYHWVPEVLYLEYTSISVDRVMEYCNIEPEAAWYSPEGKGPPDNWPSKGKISVVNLWARYEANLPYVLRGMSFEIHPGALIGIAGRTGSGKSSLVKALFRILEYDSSRGYVEIDGIKTCDIGLHELRPHMSAVPQEPLLFAATIRYNMDPGRKSSDVEIWKALEIVHLKEYINSLDTEMMSENCDNFSAGQKQLLCFARVLLNRSAIYVLDEATAFIDHKTDSFLSAQVKELLKNATVLLVAHRLHTIIRADKVLVVESGEIVEYGCPHELLKDEDGVFTKLVTNTGALNELKTAAREGSAEFDMPEM